MIACLITKSMYMQDRILVVGLKSGMQYWCIFLIVAPPICATQMAFLQCRMVFEILVDAFPCIVGFVHENN